ncbi:hypothetical protein PT974_06929 [Cladobotryum mycophilum]|uniref:Uncharacterized protein n=1 Tax=Cladobotryum mycophilum TaxID=491253 RepID=A0ABR0SNK5_9HYPO
MTVKSVQITVVGHLDHEEFIQHIQTITGGPPIIIPSFPPVYVMGITEEQIEEFKRKYGDSIKLEVK